MTTADALRELAKELRKGSGACSSSRDWNNGYLAGMQEAANRADRAAAALAERPMSANIIRFPETPVQAWLVGAPSLEPLTFQGIPVVWDKGIDRTGAACYFINTQAAEALIEAGYEAALVKVQGK